MARHGAPDRSEVDADRLRPFLAANWLRRSLDADWLRGLRREGDWARQRLAGERVGVCVAVEGEE